MIVWHDINKKSPEKDCELLLLCLDEFDRYKVSFGFYDSKYRRYSLCSPHWIDKTIDNDVLAWGYLPEFPKEFIKDIK